MIHTSTADTWGGIARRARRAVGIVHLHDEAYITVVSVEFTLIDVKMNVRGSTVLCVAGFSS